MSLIVTGVYCWSPPPRLPLFTGRQAAAVCFVSTLALEGDGKQQRSESTHPSAKRPHHGDDLQVLQIRPLRGQQLFGNEVRFVSGEPLKEDGRDKRERET